MVRLGFRVPTLCNEFIYIYIDAVCVFDPVYYNGICKIAWDSAVRGQIFLGRVLHSAFHVYVFFGCKCNYNQL